MDELTRGYSGGAAYPMAYQETQKLVRTPTMKERLDLAVQQAEKRLADVKEALEIFQRNPDIEKLLDLMQRNSF